ncbi:HAMP domain-containing sensor histidine kinase [Vitreimonas sp.]|uniref:sensor histidine kinase n=1 Tax=Vitreimonas sp. TaxID=3069702 RepID=UPI002EDB62CF
MKTATAKLPPIPPIGARLRADDPAFHAFRASAVGGSLSVVEVAGAIRAGTWPRVIFAALIAIVASAVLPLAFTIGWCVFMIAWELAIRLWLEEHLFLPAAERSQTSGFRVLAAIHFVGASAYTIFPAVAWSSDTALGMVLAAAWFCSSANHAFVYFSSERWLLMSSIVPLGVCAVLAPLFTQGVSVPAAAGIIVLASLVIAAGLFGYDRRVLLSVLAKHIAARVAAEQANAAKSQFLATMSHELRTPLNAVIGYAELIEEEAGGAQKDIAEDARKIRSSARQLLSVIDVILDLSKLETGATVLELDRVDVTAVIANLRAAAAPLAAANANTITFEEVAPLGEAEIDPVRLHQCLMQLISNATKFTRNGHIRVLASRADLQGRTKLIFEVTDTGIGISPEQQARIFEPFTQVQGDADRSYEGAGLGLTLVQRLARLMGGDVSCQSELGKGSTFILTLDAGPV